LGLGLALVRHLVEAHGGSVHAESAGVGLGATFRARFPIQAVVTRELDSVRPSLLPATPREPVTVDLTSVTVLIVNDEPDARDLLATVLRGGWFRRRQNPGSAQAAPFPSPLRAVPLQSSSGCWTRRVHATLR
jgi:hypothetical protein